MASYMEKMLAFVGPRGNAAISRFMTEFKELFVSLNEAETVDAMVSFLRLHADEFEFPRTEEDIIKAQKQILGHLLYTRKIVPAACGLSTEGQRQFNALISLVGNPADLTPATPVDPSVEYAAFYKDCTAKQYSERLRTDAGFKLWADSTTKPVEEFYS